MGKILATKWLQKPVFVYTAGLAYFLWVTSFCFGTFRLSIFLICVLGYTVFNYLIIVVAHKFKLQQYVYGVLLFFWYYVFFVKLSIPTNIIRMRYTTMIFFIIIVPTFCIIRKKIPPHWIIKINRIINLFVIVFAIVVLLSSIQPYYNFKKHAAQINAINTTLSLQGKNDILWILLDEYAAPAVLQHYFSYHDYLVDSLSAKGFYCFDSLPSRYDATLLSVTSLFDLNDSTPFANYPEAAYTLNHNAPLINRTNQLGYQFINLGIFDIAGTKRVAQMDYIFFYPNNYFEQIFYNGVLPIFVSWLSNKQHLTAIPSQDSCNQYIIKKVVTTMQTVAPTSKFVWAHLLIPHEPYFRNAKGEAIVWQDYSDSLIYKNRYTDYLSYANSVVLNILKQIPDWQHKTIVISGDHGVRFPFPTGDPRRRATFAAIYYPKMDTTELKKIKMLQAIPCYLK